MIRIHAVSLALSLLVLLVRGSPGHSADYCVTCTNPDAVYHCQVPETGLSSAAGTQLLCITELANQGGHESCSAGRGTSGPCAGTPRVVNIPDGTARVPPPLAGEPAHAKPGPTSAQPLEPEPEAPSKSGPPKTVEDLARETAKSSGEGLQKAGKAVGNAAKKTWDCVKSLFSDC